MIGNYLKIALRNFARQKVYTAINVTGLAAGMAACLLIGLFVWHETQVDRFHEHAERTFVIVGEETDEDDVSRSAATQGPLGPTLVAELPEVEAAVRTFGRSRELVRRGEFGQYEDGGLHADPAFFEVFAFPVIEGAATTALATPDAIVLTASLAERYFGEESPLGEQLLIGNDEMRTVTAVVADPPPETHLEFSYLTPIPETLWGVAVDEWQRLSAFPTYLLLSDGASAATVEEGIAQVAATHMGSQAEDVTFSLIGLPDIYLHANLDHAIGRTGSLTHLYVFSIVALLILLIACVNFVNLTTVQMTRRIQEVSMRKVLGAQRHQVAKQFLGESLVLMTAGILGAIMLATLSLPALNQLLDREIVLDLSTQYAHLAAMVGLVLLVGCLTALYPAGVLSSYRPAQLLGGDRPESAGGAFQKGLVVFQFVISIALIVGTLVIAEQLDYMSNHELGLQEEQVVVLSIDDPDAREQYTALKQELARLPNVEQVSGANSVPTGGFAALYLQPEGVEERVPIRWLEADVDFTTVLGMTISEGRDLTEAGATETAVLVNEAAVQDFGWEDPIGKHIPHASGDLEVVGVLQNFHYQALHEPIEPLIIRPGTSNIRHVVVRIAPDNVSETLSALEAAVASFSPDYPFLYSFLDADFEALYQAEERLARIFGLFALLAIIIACLGLFGLAAYTAQQRTKEIGIRKVLGATIPNIIGLLSKDFASLVVIAFVIATPVAYLAMSRWLEDFAYSIKLSPTVFVLAGLLALTIALATVSYHAIRAALTDPAKSLRYE